MSAMVDMPEMPDGDLDDVLLSYQKALLSWTSQSQVTICEKSRRIGMTWGVGADAVLTAGAKRTDGGMNVLYMGYEKEMTREFIDVCAMWSKSFAFAATEVEEFLFKDIGPDGAEKDIQAFRIRFASGFTITALCSRPRALRGKQGYVILDEAAFHDDLEEVIKAALALLIWGGKLLIISTHQGVENPFNQLIEEVKSGRLPYAHMKVTFDDAIEAGLYKRICKVSSKEWSEDSQVAWVSQIRAQFPGDSAAEELDCIPSQSGGKYLSLALLTARASEGVPVLQLRLPDGFVDQPDEIREREVLEWCREHVAPALATKRGDGPTFVGQDFARNGDLSVQWVYQTGIDLKKRCLLVIELRNIPFREQEAIFCFLCDGLPRFSGAALDARGNGQYLAERARQKYGAQKVREVMISAPWYAETWPRYRAALEDDKADVPENRDIIDDFRTVEVVRGVPVVVEKTGKKGAQRHGDAAIAGLLAHFASEDIHAGDVEVMAVGRSTGLDAFDASGQRGIPEDFYQ